MAKNLLIQAQPAPYAGEVYLNAPASSPSDGGKGIPRGALNRVLRFGAAGGFITVLDLTLVWVLSQFLVATLAVTIAYLLAVSIHFCLNKFWVFGNRDPGYARQMWKYGVVVLACWSCTVVVFSAALHTVTNHILVAKILAIPPATLLGYVMMRKFVFPDARCIQGTE